MWTNAALALLGSVMLATGEPPVPAPAAVPTSAPAKTAETTARPNILLIVSDDHGFGDISWNNAEVKTPNIERMASEGARLDRFYANPICSVTRAALLTGIATLRTGVNNKNGLDRRYRILPEVFRDAGYQTWMFGKWHLGGTKDNSKSGEEYLPHHRGFEYFYGFLNGAIDYSDHTRHDTGELDWQRNGEAVKEAGFTTDLLVDDARKKIRERDRSKPFLAYVAFNAVHGPLEAPPSANDVDRPEKRSSKRPMLVANVEHMDAAIGRLLATLDEEGLRESTLVLFFGDNGGQHSQGASNGPLRGEKGETFDGGIRVPAAIRWPGVIKPTGRSQQFLSVMDVLPTLCRAAGVPLPAAGAEGAEKIALDGLDLWSSLRDGVPSEHPPFVMGTRDPACFRAPWKLILRKDGEPLLFNIVDDPSETKDLASEHPDVVKELSAMARAMESGSESKGQKNGQKNGQGKGGAKGRQKPEKNPETKPDKKPEKKRERTKEAS